MIAIFGLLIGVLAGLFLEPTVPDSLQPHLPIAVVAALDAVFGGLRAFLDGIFDDQVFVVSFVSNVLIAALIVYLGDQLGVEEDSSRPESSSCSGSGSSPALPPSAATSSTRDVMTEASPESSSGEPTAPSEPRGPARLRAALVAAPAAARSSSPVLAVLRCRSRPDPADAGGLRLLRAATAGPRHHPRRARRHRGTRRGTAAAAGADAGRPPFVLRSAPGGACGGGRAAVGPRHPGGNASR